MWLVICVTCFTLVTQSAFARPIDTAIPDTYEPTNIEAATKVRDTVRVPVPGSDQWIELPYMRTDSFLYESAGSIPVGFRTTKKYAIYYCVEIITNWHHVCNNETHIKANHTFDFTGVGAGGANEGFDAALKVAGACYRTTFFASTVNSTDTSIVFRDGGRWSQLYQPVFSPTLNAGADMYLASAFSAGNISSYVLRPRNAVTVWAGGHNCVSCQCPIGVMPTVSRIVYGLESDSSLSEVAQVHSSLSVNAAWSSDYDPLDGGEFIPPVTPDTPKFDDVDPWGSSGPTTTPAMPAFDGAVGELLSSTVQPIMSALGAAVAPLVDMFSMFDEWSDTSGDGF